ncbi:Mra1/NEP1 like protein [Cryptosporidium canis]|uniref:Mra1/NEP1 like protein n=1 Tax=Cryptosporidium canis TaxID=195482 RepID=A0ABQ8P5H4_9CRYT|nr:Mra1/NEP1 like protein [Cryptosporidium canis]KAJ1613418.1 Mra1/NEP1 like protein [Cryptosporidium canis]
MSLLTKRNKVRKEPLTSSRQTNLRTNIILVDSSLFVNKKNGKKELLTEEDVFEGRTDLMNCSELRPDIVHNSLLMLLDSPLCKSGCLQDILISNSDGKLIRINPKFRVPRSFKLFSKVFSEFLISPNGELKLPDDDGTVLITLLNSSLEGYISQSEVVVGLSKNAKRVNFQEFIESEIISKVDSGLSSVSFVVGASAVKNSCDKLASLFTHYISFSDISIPSYICCTKICGELEEQLGIH